MYIIFYAAMVKNIVIIQNVKDFVFLGKCRAEITAL